MSEEEEWLSPEAIQAWWSSPSQSSIHRPYSSDTVASLRDAFPENHHSNAMALKLREILERSRDDGRVNIALGEGVDGVSLRLMREAGFETAYVSAGSDVSTNDDRLDGINTSSTVPQKIQALYRGQLLHSRASRLKSSLATDVNSDNDQSSSSSQSPAPSLIPLIAAIDDPDSGHGHGHSHTGIMKLVKLFVQSGVAGLHIDDSLGRSGSGSGSGSGGASGVEETTKEGDGKNVIVPVNEYLRRLTAAKLQLDVMGSEIVSIARTDAQVATHITSTVDARDRPFILGATRPLAHDFVHCEGRSDQSEWKRQARLKTLDEAFRSFLGVGVGVGIGIGTGTDSKEIFEKFVESTKKMNTSEAYWIAKSLVPSFYWNSESPRTIEGWYPYSGGVEAAISRAVIVAPEADVLWPCSHKYREADAERFAKKVREKRPGKWMAHNLVGDFSREDGITNEETSRIPAKLASLGYVWLLVPPASLTALGLGTKELNDHLKHVSRPTIAAHHADGTSSEWWWKVMGKLADDSADAIGERL
ncbi:isocitrate lyase [Kwoniella newhampshirensis]|uniref:methylisocitrate lyase n=1 Tax=Kwoniella newhampshirensis TaxID=1651941 RepID=A0AAW0Z3J9_9TREE